MISATKTYRRTGAVLLAGTILSSYPASVAAQATPAPATAPATAQTAPAATAPASQPPAAAPVAAPVRSGVIRSLSVRGNQRLELETVRAYANLTPGQTYTAETLDEALKALYATELFKDVQIIPGWETGAVVIQVQENPVINRIVLDGNKRLKEDKILPEIKLAPRQIFTPSKVRADVERIVELYRREGRFAARVEPKTVQLEQNRVDLVFEIFEGDKSKVRRINIIGNEQYSDGRLRKEMFTRQAGGLLGFFKSNDSYDPDRLAADQQKLRAFYLTEGYADFRVVSALAELTPDRRDFIITYVVEEGPRYRFGPITAESALRDLPAAEVQRDLEIREGQWFDAKAVEDAVTDLSEKAGNLGYATADIDPQYNRDAEKKVMGITFKVNETPRQYIERIDINGNTVTRDKVVRREFRVNEGDAFNAIKIKRSQDRIQGLGYFQEKLEIKDTEGSTPDRRVLSVDVEEKSTGELQLSGGYSSLERFILAFSIAQRNFRGMGQELNAGISYSRYSKSVQLGFVEPYLFDKAIMLGGEIYRRDYNSFNYIGNERNTTYSQVSTGGGLRTGFPVTEYLSFGTRYSLQLDNVSLDRATFYTDPDGAAGPLPPQCDPLRAGRYLCDEIGKRITSLLGYSAVYDTTDGIRPTEGHRATFSQDFAGLGGDVRYVRTRADGAKYWSFGSGFVFSAMAQGGYIHPLAGSPGPGRDAIRLTDRFFGPQLRGFDIRGIGPRIRRLAYNSDGTLQEDSQRYTDSIGGRAFYMGRLELEPPISAGLSSMGLRPSAFVDIGSLWNITRPQLTNIVATCVPVTANTTGQIFQINGDDPDRPANCGPIEGANGYTTVPGFREVFLGNSPKPRLSIGIGVNWVSPFGPFRIDIAKALLKQEGDDTKLFSFNVGTAF